jgi:cytochrome c oxidase cbb3-type subunit 3/ubiquinol-cytochrome c reductase cytochrome c subunit
MMKTALLWGAAGTLVLLAGACGKPKPEPLVPVEATNFEELYGENCAGCHGVDGAHGAAQALNNAVYLALIPKEKLRQITANGVPGSLMPGFSANAGGDLSDNQIQILTDGIEKWANQSAVQTAQLPPYSSASQGDAPAGEQTFQKACASCHGSKGRAGSLTDGAFLQLVTDQSLRTTTIAGRPDLGMPDWTHDVSGRALSNTDIDNLVAYISAQRNGPLTSDQPSTASGAPEENN